MVRLNNVYSNFCVVVEMQKVKVKVRKKGQITLPLELRKTWNLTEGSEIIFIYDENEAVLKPIRKVKVRENAGILGPPDSDEIEYATLDPELLAFYFEKKYGKQGRNKFDKKAV